MSDKYAQKWRGKTPEAQKETRQQIRADLRAAAFRAITAQYPGEPHSLRRRMALERARREYRTLKNLPEAR